jgi:hypothetical protein
VTAGDTTYIHEMKTRYTKQSANRSVRLRQPESDKNLADLVSTALTCRLVWPNFDVASPLQVERNDDVGRVRVRMEALLLTRLARHTTPSDAPETPTNDGTERVQRDAVHRNVTNMQEALKIEGGTPLYRLICSFSGESGEGLENFEIFHPSSMPADQNITDKVGIKLPALAPLQI